MIKYLTSISLLLLFAAGLQAQPLPACYHTRAQLYDFIFTLQDSFPQYVQVDSIGHSRGDQLETQFPIYAVKISDNVAVDEDEPNSLIIAHIHAEEVAGMEATIRYMRQLVYRINNTYRDILDNTQTYIIPTMNPDGFEIVSQGWDNTYRKNGYRPPQLNECNIDPGVGNDSCGVDLNRNFELNWIYGDTLWHPIAAEPFDYYRGPSAFSEPETRAVRDFAMQIKPAISIVWHSSRSGNVAELCIVAWLWGADPGPYKLPPDSAAIARILGDGGNGYSGETQKWPLNSGPYVPRFGGTHNGDLQDWFYWKLGTIQILTETSPGTGQIQPPCTGGADTLGALVNTLLPPIEWMSRRLLHYDVGGDMDDQGAPLAIYTKDAVTGNPISAEWRVQNTWSPLLAPWYTNESHGRATFLPAPGPITILARKEGYSSATASTSINPSGMQSITLNLQPRPWHTLGFRVKNENQQLVPARIYLGGDYPQWLELPNGTIDIEKPVSAYYATIAPDADDLIPLWRHFWLDHDTVFEYVVPSGSLSWSDDLEGGLGNWTSGGTGNNWRLDPDTTSLNYGMTLHTNASGFRTVYPNNSDTWISPGVVNVSGGNACALIFDRRGRMDMPGDSLFVEVSQDGTTWSKAGGFSDLEVSWTKSYVDLHLWTPWYLYLRFRFVTDHALGELGYHVDNFRILQGIDLDAGEQPAVIPFEYKITSAYPNPFNPSTTVTYEMAAPGRAEFSLFNLLGQEVRHYDFTLPSAGPYLMKWDGDNQAGLSVPSGIYFLQMRAAQSVSTYKLMLLK